MPIYVRGRTGDPTYHWCRNCVNFPVIYAHATPNRPKALLCPECDLLEQDGSCRTIGA
jgi:hypothetical protein